MNQVSYFWRGLCKDGHAHQWVDFTKATTDWPQDEWSNEECLKCSARRHKRATKMDGANNDHPPDA